MLRLWMAGTEKKRVAAQLGPDVKTVRRYVRAPRRAVPPGPRSPTDEQLAIGDRRLRSPVERPHGELGVLPARERLHRAASGPAPN